MNAITRYFPGFVDVGDSECVTVPFETLAQLVEIPWVKSWTQPADKFIQFSFSRGHLMAELKSPREAWVVGMLKEPVEGLPAYCRSEACFKPE